MVKCTYCNTAVPNRSYARWNRNKYKTREWLYRILYSWQDVMPRTKHERINRGTTCSAANATTISNNTLFKSWFTRPRRCASVDMPNIFFPRIGPRSKRASFLVPYPHTLNYSSDVILCVFFYLFFFKALLYPKTLETDTRAMPINRLQIGHQSP